MEGHAKNMRGTALRIGTYKHPVVKKVSTPRFDDHQLKKEVLETVGNLPLVCSQEVLTCFYLVRIGRLDTLRSADQLPRAVTKWT